MPDSKPENASAKQQQLDASEDNSTSQILPDLHRPKKVMIRLKDEPGSSEGSATSPISSLPEQIVQPRKNAIKRVVSTAKDQPYVSKEKAKKSSIKAVNSIPTKDGTSLVNGES